MSILRDPNCLGCLEGTNQHVPDCKRRPFRDHAEEIEHALAQHRAGEVAQLERVGHDDPLGELYRASTPKPGYPGVRVDVEGREWYSAAWIDRHNEAPAGPGPEQCRDCKMPAGRQHQLRCKIAPGLTVRREHCGGTRLAAIDEEGRRS